MSITLRLRHALRRNVAVRTLAAGLRLMDASERWEMLRLGAFATVSKLVDVVALASVMPVVGLIVDPTLLERSSKIHWLYDMIGGTLSPSGFILLLAGCSAVLVLISNVLEFISLAVTVKVSGRCEARLAKETIERIVTAPEAWFHNWNTGELVRIFTTDINAWAVLYVRSALAAILHTLTLLAGVVVLLSMTSLVALVGFAALVWVAYAVLRFVRPRAGRWSRSLKSAQSASVLRCRDLLEGHRDVRFAPSFEYLRDRFVTMFEERVRALAKQTLWTNLSSRVLTTFSQLALLGLALLIWARTSEPGRIAAEMAVVLTVISRILPAVNQLVTSINGILSSEPWVDNLHRLRLSLPPRAATLLESGLQPSPKSWGKLRLEDVSFSYSTNRGVILRNLDLEIKAGEYVGIVGASGSGKSTLVDILSALLTPTDGTITVDGTDFSLLDPDSWRCQIGYVGQRTYFIDSDVLTNVAFGVPPEQIDIDRVWDCLEAAGIGETIRGLPHALNTQLGENSQLLSGGQRQRLAIARALYKRPSILLLDEATNALDDDTERLVLGSLRRLRGRVTIISVSHKLSSLADADVIIKLPG